MTHLLAIMARSSSPLRKGRAREGIVPCPLLPSTPLSFWSPSALLSPRKDEESQGGLGLFLTPCYLLLFPPFPVSPFGKACPECNRRRRFIPSFTEGLRGFLWWTNGDFPFPSFLSPCGRGLRACPPLSSLV
jgi:hypothetical protein